MHLTHKVHEISTMLIASITMRFKVEMPWKEEDKYVQYHDGQKSSSKVPFIMYADFESILEPGWKRTAKDESTNMFLRMVCIQQVCIQGCSRSTEGFIEEKTV